MTRTCQECKGRHRDCIAYGVTANGTYLYICTGCWELFVYTNFMKG